MSGFSRAEFVRSIASERDFPRDGRGQIIFAGRSNVGKSSTINAITGRKNFARVSAKPGKTVFINLFDIEGSFWLVDLPGYGYSKTSLAEKQRYSKLIDDYFHDQNCKVARLYIIVDARHEPTSDDLTMLEYARSCGIPAAILANKTDKLKPSQLAAAYDTVSAALALREDEPLYLFSAEKSTNCDKVIADIRSSLKNR